MTAALLVLLGSLGAHAACDTPAHPAAIVAAARGAQDAFAELDLDGFEASRAEADAAIRCLSKPASPALATEIHLLFGLAAYVATDPDDDLVIAHFRSALAASQDASLPESIAPQGNPLRKLFDRARAAPPASSEALLPPPATTYQVDGSRAASRPTDRPMLLQLVAGDDAVLWSGLIGAGEAMPSWTAVGVTLPGASLPEPDPEPQPTVAKDRKGPRVGLLAAAGVAVAAAGGLYGVAYGWSQDYDDTSNPNISTRDDLDALRSQTNTLVWASAGALGVGIVLGTGAFIDVGAGSLKLGWRQTW